MKIGVQVYSVRDAYAADAKACLGRLKEIGYEGVELFGALATHSAAFLRSCLDEYGLELSGYHCGWQEFENEEKIQNIINYMKELDCKYVIIPWQPLLTVEQWNDLICAYNKLSARFREEGLVLGYHAHKQDLQDLENGKCAWEMLGEQTPCDFIMQIDIGNVMNGGKDPTQMYQRFASKGVTVHYKAFSKEKAYDCVIGEDDIDWKSIISISKTTPECAWAIVEKDDQDDFKTVTKCLENLKKLI